MLLKSWDELPENMQNEGVKPYYNFLEKKKSSLFFVRIFDLVVSMLMIILLSPVLVIIAVMIKFDSKGPVFYRQSRITRYGRVFRIFKFRTMVMDADRIGALVTVSNDSRITKMGQRIRKLRLDELPQLFNVFLGDMSFVGTRPEVQKYVDKYTDEMLATLLLPAGVTSLASIEYKDEDDIIGHYTAEGMPTDEAYVVKVLPEKMQYNLQGIKEFGFFRNIQIMLKTVLAVIH